MPTASTTDFVRNVCAARATTETASTFVTVYVSRQKQPQQNQKNRSFKILSCQKECGVSRVENNLRVVGGVDAAPHSWPSAVLYFASYSALVMLDGDEVLVRRQYMCGGSLIDRRTVLTAAHCILERFEHVYNNRSYLINVTTNDFNPTIGSIYSVFVGVDRYIQPDYDIKPARLVKVDKAIRVF